MSNPLFDAMIRGRAAGNGELFVDADGPVSDDAFFDVSARIASVLLDLGVTPGERVAVQVHKSIEALALYVACVRTGAVFLPLNTAYTETELRYFIDDATPRVLIVDPEAVAMGERLATTQSVLTLGTGGEGSLMARASSATPLTGALAREPGDLAAILYTSGTTGRSKGAMLTQNNLLSNAQTLVDYWQFDAQDVLLHALPIFHTHGLFVASNVILLCGGRMIFLPGFNIEAVLAALPAATTMMGVPTFYTRLLAEPRFNRQLVSQLRLFISGSAPLLAETHREFEARTGHRILERYGMTETNMNTSNPYVGERIAGTVGPALPGVEVRVCDPESHEPLGTNEVGILQVRGPNVFIGYWQMPEKTKEELLADGFFITGDLATIDEAGYVTIVGRAKDLIISGGYNIYPKEIELVIDDLPGVAESAVIGVPHPDFGEAVVAVVVRSTAAGMDASGEALDAAGLVEQLVGKLARFKQPKHVEFIDQLPRNTMGKVQKNLLRDRWEDLFS
ncbi:MAG: malonyl-CoA synthase [Granulosicoccus sp.]|nr:malonyl-CoA synthase [Granulosicoccus sp.]